MGSCVSVQKTPHSAIKKDNKLLNPSHTKPNSPANTDRPIPHISFKPQPSVPPLPTNFNIPADNKEEAAFESQLLALLESDCDEEDFLSANGDLIASCASTPGHPINLIGSPRFNGTPESPFTEKKQKLVDLLDDHFCSNEVVEHHKILPTTKEMKLVEFLEGTVWSDKTAANVVPPSTPSVPRGNQNSNPNSFDFSLELSNSNPDSFELPPTPKFSNADSMIEKEKKMVTEATKCCNLRLGPSFL